MNLIYILSQIGHSNDKYHYQDKKNYGPANFHLHTSWSSFMQDGNSTEFVHKTKCGHKSFKNWDQD